LRYKGADPVEGRRLCFLVSLIRRCGFGAAIAPRGSVLIDCAAQPSPRSVAIE